MYYERVPSGSGRALVDARVRGRRGCTVRGCREPCGAGHGRGDGG